MELAFGPMGLTPDVFWSMSPEEFDAAYLGWKARQDREDWRLGHVAAHFLNLYRDEKERPEPFDAGYFFPHLAAPDAITMGQDPEVIDDEDCGMSEEELVAELRAMKGLDD
mgnify:CR=1 FL=1